MPSGWRAQNARYQKLFFDIVSLYKKRQDLKVFLELFLTLGSVSLFTVFALKPTIITISELIKSNSAKEETISTLTKKVQALAAAHALVDKETNQIGLLDNVVPGAPSPERFVRQVEGAAYTSSVNLLSVTVGEVTLVGPENNHPAGQNASKLPASAKGLNFSVSVSGPYSSLLTFISKLENLRRPIKIDQVNLNLTTNDSGKSLVLAVSGRAPYLMDEPEKGETKKAK